MGGDWTETRVGNLLSFANGRSSPERADGLPYPVYGSNGIIGYASEANSDSGAIIIGRVGSYCGSLYQSPQKCWVTDNAIRAVAKNGNDPRFLYYLLGTLALNNRRAGSGQPLLNQDILSSIPTSVPGPSEQRAIAHILGTLDDKIELNRRCNQTLEAMARALFKDWFVDFGPVRAKMEGRAPYLPADLWQLFPDCLDDEGKPEGWENAKVKAKLNRLSAKVRYTKDQVSSYGKTPVFEQGASIILGFHDGVAAYQASAEDPAFVFGDHTCITKLSCQPFDISQNVIPLRGKDRPTMWVYYAINEKQKFEEYRRHWMELISKDLIVAPNHICLEFSRRATEFHIQMEQCEHESQTLAQIRDTLLSKLISGEVRIADAEKFMERVA